MKLSYTYSIASIALFAKSATAFAPTTSVVHRMPSFILTKESISSTSTLSMAGFGGGGGMSNKKGKPSNTNTNTRTAPVLKPKTQWDRYGNLKTDNGIRVATRVVTEDTAGDEVQAQPWYEVGKIKSEGDAFTEIAVTLQRGIIAEHAKRLYPLQFLPKDRVEWAYASTPTPEQDDCNWVLVDKSATRDVPAGVERIIGFEGKPDPATGFYCNYKGGRLVDKYDVDKTLANNLLYLG